MPRILPITAVIAATMLVSGCDRVSGNSAPVRVDTPTKIAIHKSHVVVPAHMQLSDLQARLNKQFPVQLYAIDKQEKACIAGRKIGKLKVTPDIDCHIVGHVSRGPIRLYGQGETLRLAMPIKAIVSAKNIGGIIKSETATAAAEVHAVVRLGVSPDWQPSAKVAINYDWIEPPGINFLGRRITFANKVDPKLRDVIARLEGDIPRLLQSLKPRDKLAQGWASAFTSVKLNRQNPEVWLRITPQRLDYGGYRIHDGLLSLKLSVTADAETFVGARPPDPRVTVLPPSGKVAEDRGFQFVMPVIAEYSQLEPVLEKALRKLSRKGIAVPGVGVVAVKFGKVTIYATQNGRVAIGIDVDVARGTQLIATRGKVWLTGKLVNAVGSQRVMVRDLRIDGTADTAAGNLLLAIARTPSVQAEIALGLTHDFIGDYSKLMVKIDRALTDKKIGNFVLNAKIDKIVNGSIQPLGQGLFMPVEVTGSGNLSLQQTEAAPKRGR